jgi:hypothetical protein
MEFTLSIYLVLLTHRPPHHKQLDWFCYSGAILKKDGKCNSTTCTQAITPCYQITTNRRSPESLNRRDFSVKGSQVFKKRAAVFQD